MFEDNDICRRLKLAGYRLLAACDAYVYHHASRSFAENGIDLPEQYQKAEALYRAKWGDDPEPDGPVSEELRAPDDPVELPPLSEQPRISVCIIARNEEQNIGACIDSASPIAGEVVVVDTGSTDRTAEIAAERGAKVHHFEWCDDFAAARNCGIANCSGDWVLWLDCDDRLPEQYLSRIQELAQGQTIEDEEGRPVEVGGYLFVNRCPGPRPQDPPTLVHHLRLFRRRPAIRFEHRIHEQVLPSIRRAGLGVLFVPVEIVASGHDWTPEGQEKKRQRDLTILPQELEDHPDNPFSLYSMGMTLHALQGSEEAIGYLHRSIARALPAESHLRKAYSVLVGAHAAARGLEPALHVAQDGLALLPHDPELLFRAGELYRTLGRRIEARECFERLLRHEEGMHVTSVDEGILSYRTRHALALTLKESGEVRDAELELRRAVSENPHFGPAWTALAETLLQTGDLAGAGTAIDRLFELEGEHPPGLRLRGQLRVLQGDSARARQDLSLAIALDPGNVEARKALTHALLQLRLLPEAEQEARTLLAMDGADAAARHNLATLLHETGRHAEAVEQYRAALSCRPDYPATLFGLGTALKATGELSGSIPHLAQLARLQPQNTEALYELGDSLRSVGDRGQARACFGRVLEIDPAHLAARSALTALDFRAG